jgi:hypothetical protein
MIVSVTAWRCDVFVVAASWNARQLIHASGARAPSDLACGFAPSSPRLVCPPALASQARHGLAREVGRKAAITSALVAGSQRRDTSEDKDDGLIPDHIATGALTGGAILGSAGASLGMFAGGAAMEGEEHFGWTLAGGAIGTAASVLPALLVPFNGDTQLPITLISCTARRRGVPRIRAVSSDSKCEPRAPCACSCESTALDAPCRSHGCAEWRRAPSRRAVLNGSSSGTLGQTRCGEQNHSIVRWTCAVPKVVRQHLRARLYSADSESVVAGSAAAPNRRLNARLGRKRPHRSGRALHAGVLSA